MRAIIQRVAAANVSVDRKTVGEIGRGLCVFLGVGKTDHDVNADALADKICALRIFEDEVGKMNRSVAEVKGEVLVVSQFTLYGDCRKGNRPSFSDAAPPAEAQRLYNLFAERIRRSGLKVATGAFRTKMHVSLTNDGPVTLILEM